MRKIIWTAFIILLILIVSFLGYFLIQNFASEPMVGESPQTTPPTQEEIEERITLVSEEELAAYWFNEEGRLYLMRPNGEIINASQQQLESISDIKVAPGGNKVLVNNNLVFNVVSNSWTPLPSGTSAAAWHPNNDNRVAYLQNNGLRIINLESDEIKTLLRLNLLDIQLSWPEENTILISDHPSIFNQGVVWEIDVENKTIGQTTNGFGLMINQQGDWRLQFDGNLSLINTDDGNGFNFNFNTLPHKCAFHGFIIYCAVPKAIASGITLPDDYLKKRFISSDDFYVININPSNNRVSAELLYEPTMAVDAVQLKAEGGNVYFINRKDNQLYSLEL